VFDFASAEWTGELQSESMHLTFTSLLVYYLVMSEIISQLLLEKSTTTGETIKIALTL
jgi:hypothetical protein